MGSFICWFTSQTATMARAEPIKAKSQEPVSHVNPRVLRSHPLLFSRPQAGSQDCTFFGKVKIINPTVKLHKIQRNMLGILVCIYLEVSYTEGQRQRGLPSTGSLPKWPQQVWLGQADDQKAWSCCLVSPVSAGNQIPGMSSRGFPRHMSRNWV